MCYDEGMETNGGDNVNELLKKVGADYDAGLSLGAIIRRAGSTDEATLLLIARYLGVAMSTMRREADLINRTEATT